MKTNMTVARSRKSTAQQLSEIVNQDAAIDFVLAGNPNASAHLLEILSKHEDPRVRRKVAKHPATPADVLSRLGSEFPISLFKNPGLPKLLKMGRNLPSAFDASSLQMILGHNKCPDVFGEWALRYGALKHQNAYLSQGNRSDHMAMQFCDSRYPRIVAGLLTAYDAVYIAWAKELGWIPEPPGPVFSVYEKINDWLGCVDNTQVLWDKLVPKSGCAETLQGEMVRAQGRLFGDLYRNGLGNWENGAYLLGDLARLIQSTLQSEKRFSEFMHKIINSEFACLNSLGKRSGPHLLGHNALFASNIEMVLRRLAVLITRWCEWHPEPIPYKGKD